MAVLQNTGHILRLARLSVPLSVKGQRSRSLDVKNQKKSLHIWRTSLLTRGGLSAGGSGADCKLGLTTDRPNLLSTPETLSNWTDGRISCRHWAPTSFLVILQPDVVIVQRRCQFVILPASITYWQDSILVSPA